MSLHAYEASKKADEACDDFYGLIMAAMRRADSDNTAKLREAFPDTFEELSVRYNAPLGLLPGERNPEGWHRDEAGAIFDPDGKLAG